MAYVQRRDQHTGLTFEKQTQVRLGAYQDTSFALDFDVPRGTYRAHGDLQYPPR